MSATNPMKDKIARVVVLMLENRSFDSLLGWLYYDADNQPKHNIPPLAAGQRGYDGLAGLDLKPFKNKLVSKGTTYLDIPPVCYTSALDVPNPAPYEEFKHVNIQLYGKEDPTPDDLSRPAPMNGFVQDYAAQWKLSWSEANLAKIRKIMQTYTPAQLPVLSTLARAYATSDRWFASAPTQTNCNRAFSICGTSMGLVDNGFLAHTDAFLADDRFETDTIWNVLERNGFHDWAIFWQDVFPPGISSVCYTRRVFPRLESIANVDQHFHPIDEFHARARSGTLPAFSYLEPAWTLKEGPLGWEGSDYHPPSNLEAAEEFLRSVYSSLSANTAAWERTLLVVTFDEHVGSFDHVAPPRATPPWGDDKPPHPVQHGFNFDRLGVRVPTILVSPYIADQTVFRSATKVEYDHTSIIATILAWRAIAKNDWGLGARVANAPTFEGLLSLAKPRTDDPFKPLRAAGDALEYGDELCLRNQDGEYLVSAQMGAQNYPQLGSTGQVSLALMGGVGRVQNDDIVQIKSTESTLGKYNVLGAWSVRDCYYYYTNDYPGQSWQIQRKSGAGGGPIRFGDQVYLINQSYADQRLCKDLQYLTTKKDVDESWYVEVPPQPVAGSVILFDDNFYLRHVDGEYVTGAELSREYYPRLGHAAKVVLQLKGGVGPITDNVFVQIRSTEDALAQYDLLGAWSSHNCYYYSPGYDGQSWRVTLRTTRGTSDGKVRYGDGVYLVNKSYAGQRLVKDGAYLTTKPAVDESWILEMAG